MVWSHRGGPIWGPENSIKAFKASIENNVEGVEADICLSKDGVPIVHHGNDILTVEMIRNMTAKELVQIDIGEGERIPTLEEFIQLFEPYPHILLNFDLKIDDREYYAEYATAVLDLIDEYDIALKTVVESFNHKLLRAVIDASPSDIQFRIVEDFSVKPGYINSSSITGACWNANYLT